MRGPRHLEQTVELNFRNPPQSVVGIVDVGFQRFLVKILARDVISPTNRFLRSMLNRKRNLGVPLQCQLRLPSGVVNEDRSDEVLRRRDQRRRDTESAEAHAQEVWNGVFAASQFAADRH